MLLISLVYFSVIGLAIPPKKKKYSDAQILGILKQAESGVPVSKLGREHGLSSASFYKWRAKFGGMDASMSMHNDLLKDVLGKKP